MDTEVGGMASNDFVVDFFEKVAALSERDSHNITVYILFSVKEWKRTKRENSAKKKKLEVLVQKVGEYDCKDNS